MRGRQTDNQAKARLAPMRAALAALALGACLVAAPSAQASVAPPLAHAFGEASSSRAGGWTSERMLSAAPVRPAASEAGAGASASPGGDALAGLLRTPLRSQAISDPSSYPARTHGRAFFRSGGSDFSCSGTVVSTGRGNMFVTAAHCVFDTQTGEFVRDLIFVPGYRDGKDPLGTWQATHAVVPGGWAATGSAALDTAMVQVSPNSQGQQIQSVVGSRGIGFKQPPKGKLSVYGYPAAPDPYDGEELIRCRGKAGKDPIHKGSIGLRCDMQFGASGGGWVAQKSFLVADISHGHLGSDDFIFGPHFSGPAKVLYRFNDASSYPSVRPVRCRGKLATIVGSDADEKLKGTKGKDVIASLGGDDKVRGKGGKDRICTGEGDDSVNGGGGNDQIDAGRGVDRCDGGGGRDKGRGCETAKRIP